MRARLEDIHAGPVPVARTGDDSDVTAIGTDGNRIARNRVSPSDDAAMPDLMSQAVNRLYTFHLRLDNPGFLDDIGFRMRATRRREDPKLDESL